MKPKRKKIVAWAHAHIDWPSLTSLDKRRPLSEDEKRGGWKLVKLVEHDAKRERLIRDLLNLVEFGPRDSALGCAKELREHEKGRK